MGVAEQLLGELAGSHAAPPVVDWLRGAIASPNEVDCYKINAFRLADQLALPRPDVLRSLLSATRFGLLDLNWDIHCPSCSGLPEYHKHLGGLGTGSRCPMCAMDWQIDFEEQVEVTFTVNPGVRPLGFRDLRDRTLAEAADYFRDVHDREGRKSALAQVMMPGENRVEITVDHGMYIANVPGELPGAARIDVAGDRASSPQPLRLTVDAAGKVALAPHTLAPGPVALTVDWAYRPWPLRIVATAPFGNWVSAAYVTSQQDFRDLFSGEFLAPDVAFAIQSTTLMFTDIRGSTELYETLGDAAAYALVQDHFRVMADVIRRREGGIVKTIGDAVMAAFPRNLDAVRAACEIQRELAALTGRLAGIEVKIGLHRGPTIAVTSNRALDYFGRTVNIAARVQGKSRPREVLLTDAVLADTAATAYLDDAKLPRDTFTAELKGVAGTFRVHSVRPA